jgi:hypothetical protein
MLYTILRLRSLYVSHPLGIEGSRYTRFSQIGSDRRRFGTKECVDKYSRALQLSYEEEADRICGYRTRFHLLFPDLRSLNA